MNTQPIVYLIKDTNNSKFKIGYTADLKTRIDFNDTKVKINKRNSKICRCGSQNQGKALDKALKKEVEKYRLKKQYKESGGTEWFDIGAWKEVDNFIKKQEIKDKYGVVDYLSLKKYETATSYQPVIKHVKYAEAIVPFTRFKDAKKRVKTIAAYKKRAPEGMYDYTDVPSNSLPYAEFASIAALPSITEQRHLGENRMKTIHKTMSSEKFSVKAAQRIVVARVKELGSALVVVDGSSRIEETRRGLIEKATTGYSDVTLIEKFSYEIIDTDTVKETKLLYYALDNAASRETAQDIVSGAVHALNMQDWLEHKLLMKSDYNQTLINTLEMTGTMSVNRATALMPEERLKIFVPTLNSMLEAFPDSSHKAYPTSFIATTLPLAYAFRDNPTLLKSFYAFITAALEEHWSGNSNKNRKTGIGMFVNEFYSKEKEKSFRYYQGAQGIKQQHAATLGLVLSYFYMNVEHRTITAATAKKLRDKEFAEYSAPARAMMKVGKLIPEIVVR